MELPNMTDCVPASPQSDRLRTLIEQLRNTCDEIELELENLAKKETVSAVSMDQIGHELASAISGLETVDVLEPESQPEPVEAEENQLAQPIAEAEETEEPSLEQPTSDSDRISMSANEITDVLDSFSSPEAVAEVEAVVAVTVDEPLEIAESAETLEATESTAETINISEMLENREPKEPVIPPAEGGTVLSEDELLAMLSEAESRAEDIDGESDESPLTVVMGGAQQEAADHAPPAEINEELVDAVPAVLALAALAVPIRKDGETLVLAVAEPIDAVAIANIESHLGASVATEPRPMLEVLELLRSIYKDGKVPVA